jgi:hypothetical protein
MFFDSVRGARRVLVATTVLTAGACSDPDLGTQLRPEGPPEVLAVLVMNDPAAQLKESPTFCKTGDKKRPTVVGLPDFTTFSVCDADPSIAAPMVMDAYPDNWYIRVMFDELLDPDVERLTEILNPDTGEGTGTYEGHLAGTRPVNLQCESVNGGGMVDVEYDGYYSPSGNAITWPLGPSLVIKPNHPELVATTKKCQVTLTNVIKDKQGEQVPSDQLGPYAFHIAPITPILIDPSESGDPDAPTEVDAFYLLSDGIYVLFNTDGIDEDSLSCDDDDGNGGMKNCEFGFAEVGGAAIPDDATTSSALSGAEYAFSPVNLPTDPPLETQKTYTFELREGAKVKDRCSVETTFGAPSPATNSKVTFTTNPFDFKRSSFGNGDTVTALRKPSLVFNNVIDLASLDAAEYTLTPAPEQLTVGTSTKADLYFSGNYRPGTMYTLTLKAGATVQDYYGATYTQSGDKTIMWTVAPIAITSTSPANNGMVAQGTTNTVRVSFNQSMAEASIAASEWEVTNANGDVVPFSPTVSRSGCNPNGSSTTCALVFESIAQLPLGDYTFTLKAGATIDDVLTPPTTYTQTADRVIDFTVVPANTPPTPTPIQCL